ncbi:MAG: helix-turn-helix domain-containing protein [Roseburia sp.]|jgi:two-component system response regulator YesN|nr:helix-turn-helix domain-containing protein [Roseburia sp.]
MRILIVDDQKPIVESLKSGINWEALAIEEVFTACSAKEARLVLVNFQIELLLTDIEMPEEDGLSLFRWARERDPGLVGIFLTSHADFHYAKQAIGLGGFDYILQPARYGEVERVLSAAIKTVQKNARIRRLERTTKLITQQRDSILDLMLSRYREERREENQELFVRLRELFDTDLQPCEFYPLWISVVHFEKITHTWDEKLIRLVIRNVLEELLEREQVKICVASEGLNEYLVFAACRQGALDPAGWERGVREFIGFVNSHMDFAVALYPEREAFRDFREERIDAIRERRKTNTGRKAQLFWEDLETDPAQAVNEERIEAAVRYIRNNISRNLSRAEVAETLHLNEEYFSRLFKKYTGYTFKDYEMMERIGLAKKLLEHSRFSISIIASKVGYDNFSHFSKIFKKMTGYTPQEWRKEKGTARMSRER